MSYPFQLKHQSRNREAGFHLSSYWHIWPRSNQTRPSLKAILALSRTSQSWQITILAWQQLGQKHQNSVKHIFGFPDVYMGLFEEVLATKPIVISSLFIVAFCLSSFSHRFPYFTMSVPYQNWHSFGQDSAFCVSGGGRDAALDQHCANHCRSIPDTRCDWVDGQRLDGN